MVHSAVHRFRESNEELEHMDSSSTTVHNSICLRWGLVCLQWVAEGVGVGVGVWGYLTRFVRTHKKDGGACVSKFLPGPLKRLKFN